MLAPWNRMRDASPLSERAGGAGSAGSAGRRFGSVGAIFVAAFFCEPESWASPSNLPPQVGYNYGQTETPGIAATAGALRATSNSTSALFINPANMAATRVYHIGAFAQIWPQANRQSYGAAIVDSIVSSAKLAGGLGGSYTRQDPDGVDRTAIDVRFALAYPFSDMFFVGADGRYLSLEEDGYPKSLRQLGPSVASGGLHDDPIVKSITFDAGMTLKPIDHLYLSIVGSNLTDPGNGFLPLTLGGGIGYVADTFSLEGDVLGDFSTYDNTTTRAMAGGGVLVADHFPLKLGYRYDEGAQSHAITGGLGYLDKAYAVELSLQRVVSGDPVTVVVFGFTYHVEATGLTPGIDEGYEE